MPSAKLELTKDEAGKAPAAHDIAGTRTTDAFPLGDKYITTISGRSTESLVKFGMTLGSMDAAGVKAYEARVAKKLAAAKKPATV